MNALGASLLLCMSSTGFAEIVMNSSGNSGQANISWSSEEANLLLNGDVSANSASSFNEPSEFNVRSLNFSITEKIFVFGDLVLELIKWLILFKICCFMIN